jgi:hypothetical protein
MIRLRDAPGGTRSARSWIKLVSNCLPGRWGQSLSRWEDAPWLPCHPPWDAWTVPDGRGGIDRWRSLGWRTQREVRGQWGPEAVPAAAAYVVSPGARLALAGHGSCRPGDVIYCDTDGLMLTRGGYERLTALRVPVGRRPRSAVSPARLPVGANPRAAPVGGAGGRTGRRESPWTRRPSPTTRAGCGYRWGRRDTWPRAGSPAPSDT